MTFTESIATCFSKYTKVEGRASRSEYWWFYLFTLLLSWGASIVGAVTLGSDLAGIPSIIVSLATLCPAIASGCRRLHDTGRSGWWLLISFTCIGIIPLIVWLAAEGDKQDNKYGSIP